MKLLHIHFGKEGGAERFFVSLARALGERGVEQRFVIRPGRTWEGEIAPLGPIIRNNYRNLSLSKWITRARVHRMISRWQPDAVMAWMNRAGQLIPAEASGLKLIRLGDYPRSLKHYRNCDCIVSNTPGIAEKCRRLGWERPVHVISNFPREVAPRPVSRASLDTPEEAFLIVSSGRFVGRKGFDVVLRAAARVPDAWVWLVGDGEKRGELEALARALGIIDRVRFTGWVDEPIHHVAAGDAYVMASRHEPLGNVILEAWQAGVPVVTTRAEGPEWFVEDGRDALMVAIDDDAAMAGALARIRDDHALAASLTEAGREKLEARFSKQAVVDRYLALFEGRL